MKILVLQLARLGDIYLSWPALRALRRANPEAEIQLLVRPRFEAATHGLTCVDRVRVLPTEELLEPLAEGDDHGAVERTLYYLNALRAEKYDRVINLTFSPLSSWITKSIATPEAQVQGYSRHADGFLNLPDGVSAYFYAQVGTDRQNRIHLSDIFATLMNVELDRADWAAPALTFKDFGLPAEYLVLHMGASESHKRISPFQWARALKHYRDRDQKVAIVVIGAAGESSLVDELRGSLAQTEIFDLLGQTSLEDVFGLLARAKLLVGGDSSPMHMASFTGTPTLCVSAGRVNFWETGPRSPKTWIMSLNDASDFPSERVGTAMADIVHGVVPADLMRSVPGIPAYEGPPAVTKRGEFAWDLMRAIYLGEDFPVTENFPFVQAVVKMREMNSVILKQLAEIPAHSENLGPLLDGADDVIKLLGDTMPEMLVLSRWVQTEKTRIPPGSREATKDALINVHEDLGKVLQLYSMEELEDEGQGYGTI